MGTNGSQWSIAILKSSQTWHPDPWLGLSSISYEFVSVVLDSTI